MGYQDDYVAQVEAPLRKKIRSLENQLRGARAFMERHPALTPSDRAEFEAFVAVENLMDKLDEDATSRVMGRDGT